MPERSLVFAFGRRVLRDDGVLSAIAALVLAVLVALLKAVVGAPTA